MPKIARALSRVKQSYAAYCERLLTLEDAYRAMAREELARTAGSVELNESHFYRSILAEVDRPSGSDAESEYRYSSGSGSFSGSFSVGFDGVQLISRAEDSVTAQYWVELHRRWCREMRPEHIVHLLAFRQEIQDHSRVVVAAIERLKQGGLVPGRCDRSS
jgi:hypothetical protein